MLHRHSESEPGAWAARASDVAQGWQVEHRVGVGPLLALAGGVEIGDRSQRLDGLSVKLTRGFDHTARQVEERTLQVGNLVLEALNFRPMARLKFGEGFL